jgi:hypothetical protein
MRRFVHLPPFLAGEGAGGRGPPLLIPRTARLPARKPIKEATSFPLSGSIPYKDASFRPFTTRMSQIPSVPGQQCLNVIAPRERLSYTLINTQSKSRVPREFARRFPPAASCRRHTDLPPNPLPERKGELLRAYVKQCLCDASSTSPLSLQERGPGGEVLLPVQNAYLDHYSILMSQIPSVLGQQ